MDTPRDRLATFEPAVMTKHQRRLADFDDQVIGMYTRDMSVREFQGNLLELYGKDVSPQLISTITDESMAEASEWQGPPLDDQFHVAVDMNVVVSQAEYIFSRAANRRSPTTAFKFA